MTFHTDYSGEEKRHTRIAVMLVMIVLVTVLLYQVIDGVQRRAYQKRRELRRQQWREFRMREEARLREVAATQPYLDVDGGGPRIFAEPAPSGGGGGTSAQ